MITSALAQLQNERKKVISIKFLANALNIAKTTYFIINSSTNGHYIGRQGVTGGVEFYKIGQRAEDVHSTLWKYSLYFAHFFRTYWNLFMKLGSSDPSFNWTIWTILHLKSETSAHTWIAVIHYYILLLQVPDMIWIWNLHWGNLFDKWSWSTVVFSIWSPDFFLKMNSGL